jgi:hypothetical protein
VENAETVEEAASAILNSIRNQMRAYLAEFVATAAMKALKSVPFPFNLIAATAAGGAATLLFNKLVPEFYGGGHTGDGGKYEPAGIVHKKEYVIPREGTENPTLKPIIDIIEMARQSGSLNRLDLSSIVQQIPQRGYASGGYTGTSAGISPPSQGGVSPALPGWGGSDVEKFNQAIDKFTSWRPAVNLDITEVAERLDRLEKINEQSKLK